jgi:hypothetical protein
MISWKNESGARSTMSRTCATQASVELHKFNLSTRPKRLEFFTCISWRLTR